MSTDYLSRDSFDGAGGGSPYPSAADLPENFIEDTPAAAPAAVAAPDLVASFINDQPAASDRKLAIARSPGPVVAEAIEASDDNNTATRQTVEMMCEYVRRALTDPYMAYLARGACQLFARGQTDPQSAAWAVFWFLKHRVKKTYDEATMFRLGVPNQQDLLTDPRVLLRSKDAAEDCDGFTMAAWALLVSIGVDVCMVTVACDPADRARWSHVFTMVKLPDGSWFPLDCSHGTMPGWMVPRAHISRWQAWDLNGQPIEAKPPGRSTLHGYMYRPRSMGARRRGVSGLGQDDGTDSTLFGGAIDTSGDTSTISTAPIVIPPMPTSQLQIPAGESFGQFIDSELLGGPSTPNTGLYSMATNSVAGGTPTWLQALSTALTGGAKIAQVASLPSGYTLNAAGQVVPIGAAGIDLSSLGSYLPIILVIGGILLVVSFAGGKR